MNGGGGMAEVGESIPVIFTYSCIVLTDLYAKYCFDAFYCQGGV